MRLGRRIGEARRDYPGGDGQQFGPQSALDYTDQEQPANFTSYAAARYIGPYRVQGRKSGSVMPSVAVAIPATIATDSN